jgi:hypothetical protein
MSQKNAFMEEDITVYMYFVPRLEFPLSINISNVGSHNFVSASERKSRDMKSDQRQPAEYILVAYSASSPAGQQSHSSQSANPVSQSSHRSEIHKAAQEQHTEHAHWYKIIPRKKQQQPPCLCD